MNIDDLDIFELKQLIKLREEQLLQLGLAVADLSDQYMVKTVRAARLLRQLEAERREADQLRRIGSALDAAGLRDKEQSIGVAVERLIFRQKQSAKPGAGKSRPSKARR